MKTKVKKFINEFPNRNCSPLSLNKLLTKLYQTRRPTVNSNHNSGKKRNMRNRGLPRTLIQLSQENARALETIRQIQETGIPKTSVRRIKAAML